MLRTFTFLLIFFSSTLLLLAEGTREVSPNRSVVVNGNQTTDVAALLINHPDYGRFARMNGDDPHSRLYVNIQNPTKECIYIGFSYGHLNYSTPTPPGLDFSYVIKDPNGKVVYGPDTITFNNANIRNWEQGFNGPQPLGNTNGYLPIIIDNIALGSQGWNETGDYYIEFSSGPTETNFLIDFWDITVVNCETSTPVEKKGRVWSYNWALFAINDYGFPHRPFNGAFYACSPDKNDVDKWFITKVDFNGSGFKPAAFNVAFNRFGTRNTGDINYDRQSVENANLTNPEYPIFLNDPIEIYETAEAGQIEFISLSREISSEFCINVIPTSTGQIDLLIDLDNNDGIYTENTRDVLITHEVMESMVGTEICIPWDGLDGEGNPLLADSIPLVLAFNQGIYHFPVYDAEFMEDGFTILRVRPAGPPPLLYYDDSQISVSSGTGEPKVNLGGCILPCHSWTTYIHPDIPGYGNMNTINSWWFSSTSRIEIVAAVPNELHCSLIAYNTLCENPLDTIYVSLDTIGPSYFNIIDYLWTGPAILESTLDYAVVDEYGTYTFTLFYINNSGDSLQSDCALITPQGPNLGSCPSDSTIVSLNCLRDIPPSMTTLDEFLEAGYELGDTTCLNFAVLHEEKDNDGTGCQNDPLLISRKYTVFHDANANGFLDADEFFLSCTETYEIIDSSTLEIEFDNPLLEGKESGDTLYFQCEAGNIDWELPELHADDLAYANACEEPQIDFSYTKIADGSCVEDGFLARYKYQWDITSQCDTISLFIVVEMIDTIAPVFLSNPRDTTVYCADSLRIPPPPFSEECCCSSVDYKDEVGDCKNGKTEIIRTWVVSDICGNSASINQKITLIDTFPLIMTFVDGDLSHGDHIQVECHHGKFPPEIEAWDKNTASVSTSCTDIAIRFKKKPLNLGPCVDNVKEQWEFSWTATDECGNSAEIVIYVDLIDTTPPKIVSIPENTCDGFPALDDYYATDNCGLPEMQVLVKEIYNPACPDVEHRKYTYTATDHCGNTSQISRIFTKGDVPAPIMRFNGFRAGSDNTLILDCGVREDVTRLYSENAVVASSACSELQGIYFAVESSDEGTCVDGIYRTDKLRWTAIDICGNTSHLYLTVKYRDLEAPIIPDFRSEVYVTCPSEVPQYNTIIDCSPASIVSDNMDYIEECKAFSTARRVIVVEDVCGNSATYVQKVHIDRSKSIQIFKNESVICESETDITPLLYDLCYDTLIPATFIGTKESSACSKYFKEVRIWEIHNVCGGVQRLEQMVLKENAPAPEIVIYHPDFGEIAHNSTIQLDCTDDSFGEWNFKMENSCGVYAMQLEIIPVQTKCVNRVLRVDEYVYTATDMCGKEYSAAVQVEYIDRVAPEFTIIPEDMTLSCADDLPVVDVGAYDLCSEVDLEYREIPFTQTGKPGFTRIWIAKDACGNINTIDQVTIIEDKMNCYIEVPDDLKCWSSTEIEVFISGGTEPYTYEWKAVSGECLLHYTSDEPTAVITVLSDSVEVQVTITDVNGCEIECSVTIECNGVEIDPLIGGTDGVSLKPDLEDQVLLFPNPSKDILFLESLKEIENLSVFSADGRQLKYYEPMNNTFVIHHDFRTGLYFLKLEIDGEILVKRFIVQ